VKRFAAIAGAVRPAAFPDEENPMTAPNTDADRAPQPARTSAGLLSPQARDLIAGANFAVVATVNADGSLQQSVVWIRERDGELLFSTVHGRAKYRNLARNPNVSVLVIDRADGYRYSAVRGVARFEDDHADELVAELSQKYIGEPWVETQTRPRVVVAVTPTRVTDYHE
jgi:PPOX class probable F420-dependent enzyme